MTINFVLVHHTVCDLFTSPYGYVIKHMQRLQTAENSADGHGSVNHQWHKQSL